VVGVVGVVGYNVDLGNAVIVLSWRGDAGWHVMFTYSCVFKYI